MGTRENRKICWPKTLALKRMRSSAEQVLALCKHPFRRLRSHCRDSGTSIAINRDSTEYFCVVGVGVFKSFHIFSQLRQYVILRSKTIR